MPVIFRESFARWAVETETIMKPMQEIFPRSYNVIGYRMYSNQIALCFAI